MLHKSEASCKNTDLQINPSNSYCIIIMNQNKHHCVALYILFLVGCSNYQDDTYSKNQNLFGIYNTHTLNYDAELCTKALEIYIILYTNSDR